MNGKALIYKAPRMALIAAFVAVALSALLLMGGMGASAAAGVEITVEHIYEGVEDSVKRVYTVDAGVYGIEEFYEIIETRGSDVIWDFLPEDNGGASTIELEVGSKYAFKVYYALRLYNVEVILNGGSGNPSGEGQYKAGVNVTVNAGTRSGFTFNGWTVKIGGVATPHGASASFLMPGADVTIEANWTPIPPAESPGQQESPEPPDPTPEPPEPTPGPPPTDPPETTDVLSDPDDADYETPYSGNEQELQDIPRHEPGGTDPSLPPVPTIPGNMVIPGDNGVFIEFDGFGTPLGEWSWDDFDEIWVFEEYPPPLSMLPATGDSGAMALWAFALCMSLLGSVLLCLMFKKEIKDEILSYSKKC